MLSIKDVAERLGVSTTVIRGLIRWRHIDAVRVGRAWRIDPKSLDAYLKRNSNIPGIPTLPR